MKNTKAVVNYNSIVTLRIMISLIFIVASLSHLLNTTKTVERLEKARFGPMGHLFGPPEIPVILSGAVMFLAGIFLLLGFKTKFSAIVLILVLIPITITIQMGQIETLGPLFKNIAILGGLIFFVMNPELKK